MAFCTICGKQLADGEVCTCQQNNAQSVPNVIKLRKQKKY